MAYYLPRSEDEINMELLGVGESYIDTMIKDAIIALIKASQETGIDIWQFMATYTPPNGFMFSDHTLVSAIMNHMTIGHSGTTFGCTMRELERIAKNGRLEVQKDRKWIGEIITSNNEECSICNEEDDDKEKINTPCCKKVFCKICIEKWLSKNTTCPLCRKSI
jgi:hypothetical protein